MRHRKIRLLPIMIFIIVITILTLVIVGYYFRSTTKGSAYITRFAISRYLGTDEFAIKKTQGNLSQGLILQEITIDNMKWLPEGGSLRIQEIILRIPSFGVGGIKAEIHNGQLKLPYSDPILFYGSYEKDALALNLYSKKIDIAEVLEIISNDKALKKVSGVTSDLDVSIVGTSVEPILSGKFLITEISHNGFSVVNCPGSFNLKAKNIKSDPQLYGQILLEKGVISGPKNVVAGLLKSKILFNGDMKSPSFDLHGTANIEEVKINISVKGTPQSPDLKLSSEPPMAQERLLLMLGTGKRWRGAEEALTQGQISADLAKDFIDYFVFGGSGGKISREYGVDISLKYDGQTKGIAVKKSLSEKAAASYSIEQPQRTTERTTATHKAGGEYKITENISIEGEKELKQTDKAVETQDKPKTDDKVLIKYKKNF